MHGVTMNFLRISVTRLPNDTGAHASKLEQDDFKSDTARSAESEFRPRLKILSALHPLPARSYGLNIFTITRKN